MKTAEKWYKEKEWSGNEDGDGNLLPYEFTVEDIEQIQLDAMKEGARRAAEMARNACAPPATKDYLAGNTAANAILSTAKQWTTKDL